MPCCRASDSDRWNSRYATEGEVWQSRPPRKLLTDYAQYIPTHGIALDAACGVANNGLFLAQHGLRVLALDISEIALRIAKQRADQLQTTLYPALFDLVDAWLPPDYFDVIVNFNYLERTTFPVYRLALKNGGLLLFESFVKTADDVLFPEYYLFPGELLQAFADFEILHYAEKQIYGTTKLTAQLVARKVDRSKQ